jgi:hypothetical protein
MDEPSNLESPRRRRKKSSRLDMQPPECVGASFRVMDDGINDGASASYGAGNGFGIANIRLDGFEMLVIVLEDGPHAARCLNMTRTESPRASKRRTILCPRNPVPPNTAPGDTPRIIASLRVGRTNAPRSPLNSMPDGR